MLLLTLALAAAQAAGEDIEDLSLEKLLDTPTTVASARATKLRETPGVVTVITREDILASGARDLMDVLLLVPGFTFGTDVQGIVDVSFRGVWAHEGKVLLLYDGIEMNETLYSTLQMGDHYPIANIERVEIIRGPGSALYGGFAELAVINIVTRTGDQIQGGEAWGDYGQMRGGLGRRDVGLTYGQRFSGIADGLTLSLDGMIGQSNRTDRDYRDVDGKKVNLAGLAANDPAFVDIGVGYKGLELRLLADDYRSTSIDAYDALLPAAANENFMTLAADLKWAIAPMTSFVITPHLQVKRQYPWNAVGSPPSTDGTIFYNKVADRYRGGLTLAWDVLPTMNLMVGDEVIYDYAERLDAPSADADAVNTFFGTKETVSYWNEAAFGQLLVETSLLNVTAGARFEYHQQFGPSFVPRVALTRTFDRLSLKLLVSGAFRSPGIENINLNAKIKPERTRVYEAEIGYEVTDNVAVTLNAFDLTIDGPIVYSYDDATNTELYENFASTGSRGAEIEARIRDRWGSITLGYSYASAEGKNLVPLLAAPGVVEVMRAMPAQKLTAAALFKLVEHVTLSPSLVYMSERYGYLGDPSKPLQRLGPVALVNVVVRWTDALTRGLDLDLGVDNLLDAEDQYIQPYDGGHGPIPAPSRTVFAAATFHVGL